MFGENIRAGDCNLGDSVNSGITAPFSAAVVIRKDEDKITCFRPYAVTSDFEYTGGVIPYVGHEIYNVPNDHIIVRLEEARPKM